MTAILSTNGVGTLFSSEPPRKLLVATTEGAAVLERKGLGDPWMHTGQVLTDRHISALMVVGNGSIFAAAHNGGLFRSDDDGMTWESIGDDITMPQVYSLGVRELEDGAVLYAGTEPVGLFESRDNGATWAELPAIKSVPGHERWSFPPPPHDAHTKSFLFDLRHPDTFYVTIEQGALLKTEDGGQSWRELDEFSRPDDEWYKDVHRLISLPSDPDEIYMLTGIGLYCSQDAGETWQRRTDQSFRIGYPDQLILSPQDERLMFMCGAGGNPTTWRKSHRADGWVMRTRDGGRSWEEANKGLPVMAKSNIEAFSACCYPGGYELYAGNTDGEIYSSDDDGETWTRIAEALRPVSKGTHYRVIANSAA